MSPMRSLIYSADSEFISAFKEAAATFHLEYEVTHGAAELIQLCAASPYDLIVVDFDPALGGIDLLPVVRRESANREVVIFAGAIHQTAESVIALGASVCMYKPIAVDMARRHLRDALMITDGERRQFARVAASSPVYLLSVADGKIEGTMLNIGEGGVAMKLLRSPKERSSVEVGITLPGRQSQIRAVGKITWADPAGNVGIRFNQIEPELRKELIDWIVASEKSYSQAASAD